MSDHVEKIDGWTHYWKDHPFSMKEDKVKEIHKTNMTPEVFSDCFISSNWWSPIPDKKEWLGNHNNGVWELGYPYQFPPVYVLFDSLDGEKQIVRILGFINPEHKSLNESGRYIFNPKTGECEEFSFPDKRFNPWKDCYPWKGYKMGGYSGSTWFHNLGETFFYFRTIVPGVKTEKVFKRIFQEILEYGDWGYNTGRFLIRYPALIFGGNSLLEILWNLGYKKDIYGGSITPKITYYFKELEKYRKSFLIARREGVDFSDQNTLYIWVDLIKILENNGYDIKSSKWIAGNVQENHDRLIKLIARKKRKEELKLTLQKENLYHKRWGRFLEKEIKVDNITIIPVQSVSDCYDVGRTLMNCCYSAGYYQRSESLLLKAYVGDTLMELAEVDHNNILQCSGYRNRETEHHTEILKVVEKWITENF